MSTRETRTFEVRPIPGSTIDWIASTDRLPELGKEVLVCRRGYPDSVHKTRLVESDYILAGDPRYTRHKEFAWHNGQYGERMEGTYWSPLPEVPPFTPEEAAQQEEFRKLMTEQLSRMFRLTTA